MEERKKLIRNFAEKFHTQIKKRKREPENLMNELKSISSSFQLSFKEEKSYEEALESILKGNSKNERSFSKEWFTILIGEFLEESPKIEFLVSKIRDSFKRNVLSSFHLPFTKENLSRVFNNYFSFLNERSMEYLLNEIVENIDNKRSWSYINLMLSVKRDLIGPTKIVPSLFFTHYTTMISANLLYVTAPIRGKGIKAAVEIYYYYPTNTNTKLLRAILDSREIVKDLEYTSSDLHHYFLLSKELEICLRKRRK